MLRIHHAVVAVRALALGLGTEAGEVMLAIEIELVAVPVADGGAAIDLVTDRTVAVALVDEIQHAVRGGRLQL
ncbi:hypothetical protein D9M72_611320 [compost metagenome]